MVAVLQVLCRTAPSSRKSVELVSLRGRAPFYAGKKRSRGKPRGSGGKFFGEGGEGDL